MRSAIVLCAVLLVLAFVGVPAQAEWATFHPFGSSNIRYSFDTGWPPPEEVNGLGFDDSGWNVGTAPFGMDGWTYDGVSYYICPELVATPWGGANQNIVIRFWVNLPAGFTDVQVRVRFVSSMRLTVNGSHWIFIGNVNACPYREYLASDHNYFPGLFHPGLNLIAVSGREKQDQTTWNTYLDVEVSADVPHEVAVESQTWGAIKSLYR